MKNLPTFEDFINENNEVNEAVDSEELLKVIDGTKESILKKDLFDRIGTDYIDTPGNFKEEKDDYEDDIFSYYKLNMGKSEFDELIKVLGDPKNQKVINSFYKKYKKNLKESNENNEVNESIDIKKLKDQKNSLKRDNTVYVTGSRFGDSNDLEIALQIPYIFSGARVLISKDIDLDDYHKALRTEIIKKDTVKLNNDINKIISKCEDEITKLINDYKDDVNKKLKK